MRSSNAVSGGLPTREGKEVLIGTSHAAQLLGVGLSTVQRWIDSGDIPAHRTLGGHRRIQMRHLLEVAHAKGLPLLGEEAVASRTVLVIDDEPDVVETLSVRIRGMRPDLNVLTAESGFKAGLLVRSCAPALVLLDIRMPGMNGIEVCRMLREDPVTAHSQVVGLTAYRDPHDVDALRSAGATDVFFKPFDPEMLESLLERVLPRTVSQPTVGGETGSGVPAEAHAKDH